MSVGARARALSCTRLVLMAVEQKDVDKSFEIVAEHVKGGINNHLVGILCQVTDVNLYEKQASVYVRS